MTANAYSNDKTAAEAAAAAAGGAGGRALGGSADIDVTESPDGSRHFAVKSGGGSSAATAAAEAAAAAASRAEASSKANASKTDALELMLWAVIVWIGVKIFLAGLTALGWITKNPLA
jgi:hypothetical protein